MTAAAQKNGFTTADDLYNAIGYGELSAGKILPKILEELAASNEAEDTQPAPDPTPGGVVDHSAPTPALNSGIVVDGADGCGQVCKMLQSLPGMRWSAL